MQDLIESMLRARTFVRRSSIESTSMLSKMPCMVRRNCGNKLCTGKVGEI